MIRAVIAALRQFICPGHPDTSAAAFARWVALDGRTPDRPGVIVRPEGEAGKTITLGLRHLNGGDE